MSLLPRLSCVASSLILAFGLGCLEGLLPETVSASSPPAIDETLVEPPDEEIIDRSNVIELENSPKALVDEVWQLVNHQFVDAEFNQTDWLATRQSLLERDYKDEKAAYRAIQQLLKDLNDPYTRFLPPDAFAMLTSQTSGEVSGIGIQLVVDKRSSDLIVANVLRGTPAMEAGIRPGDRLVRIDGKPTALMTIEQAMEALDGEAGTELSLQFSRYREGSYTVTVARANIEVDSVTYAVKEQGGVRIGYIRLDEFSSHAAEQMEAAIKELSQENITGFVLDLRGNPGGLLFSSIEIARMWLDRGEIVFTIDRKGGDRHFSANHSELSQLPLVVLINDRSASASEILAGALQVHGRATLVGTETYGKGTVQSVHSLSDKSGLAVTVARYFPPNGEDIDQKGISPDIYLNLSMDKQLQLRNDPSLMGTEADPQYLRAVNVLEQYQTNFGLPPAKSLGIRPTEPILNQ